MNIFHENWLDNSIQPFQILQKAHSNSIETLQFNPLSANEIATGSHDRLVKIWDIVKFKETQQLKGHQQGVWSLSYSLDGKQIISGSPDKSLIVWDLKSGKAISSLKEHKNKIYWVTCSDNGSYLASGGQDGHIIIWDMRKLKLVKDIESSVDIVQNVHFSLKSQYFFSGDSVGNIKAYDSVSLNQISNNIPKRENPNKIHVLQSIAQDNGTVKLFSAQSDKSLSVLTFDPKQKQIKKESETVLHFDELHSLSIDKTKTMFSTGCRDGTSRVWSMRRNERGYQVIANLLGHNQRVTSAEFHPTSKLIATCSWDQNIHLYKI